MIRVYLSGPHADRSPLSYPVLSSLFDQDVLMLNQPDGADLLVFSHSLDIEGMPHAVYDFWRRSECPIVLLSEEPFWDTVWGKKPLKHTRELTTMFGAVPVRQLNHHTSDIFDFDKIPYYLLTNLRFGSAYAFRFRRNAAIRAERWQSAFADYPVDISFMAERRREVYHNLRHKAGGIIGLCAWRTELASACEQGRVERIGQSWNANWNHGRSRFDIGDWHLDKLTRQDRQSRLFSGLENTHQPNYMSEKIFDAYALGAKPFYYAAQNHRIHDFKLPENTWTNLYGLSVSDAAKRLNTTRFDLEFFEAYREAQAQLEQLFTEPELFLAERYRLQQAVLRALSDQLNSA